MHRFLAVSLGVRGRLLPGLFISLIALLILGACGGDATATPQPTDTPAPPPVAQNTVAFQDFGWDPDTAGASGSITYEGVKGSFQATVKVNGLKPSND